MEFVELEGERQAGVGDAQEHHVRRHDAPAGRVTARRDYGLAEDLAALDHWSVTPVPAHDARVATVTRGTDVEDGDEVGGGTPHANASYCPRRSGPSSGGEVVDSLETLLYEERDGVAIVTMNRPEVHNAFNRAMERELKQMWSTLRYNNDVRAVVLTGAGEKAFCSGLDREESIKEYLDDPTGQKRSPDKAGRVSTPFMFNDIGANINPKQNDLWKPVIAAVNGMACGGAFYLLGESDIIIAAEHATFFDPHVTYGMVAGFETVHLMQKVPFGEMLRIALLGSAERLSAERAHQIGLVSEIAPAGELMDRAFWVARQIAMLPPLAIQGTLRSAWMAHEAFRRDALAQISIFVSLGTQYDNIKAGQDSFHGQREKPRVR
jgi:enoyl-CoA hydratase/carnithine racemase